jgi:hypothetical protein
MIDIAVSLEKETFDPIKIFGVDRPNIPKPKV